MRFVILSAPAFSFSVAWAAGGAHEHGAAELFLSAEGRDVQITLNAPAQSLVGFEIAALTQEQRAAVERAEAMLMAPSDLFVLEGNSCELINATVDVSSIAGVGNAQSQPEEHADHIEQRSDHADEHADHDDDHASTSDKHDQEHHDNNNEGDEPAADSHSDVSATYSFKCESETAPMRIAFKRGGLPFGLERIDVFWVADWGQGAGQATPQSPQVNLRN